MKIGVSYPVTEVAGDPDAIRKFVRAAEELGYTHVMTYDHVLKTPHENREPKLTVNMSSSSAQTGSVDQVHYSASKGAVVAMTRSLAQALGPMGITVNNIPPGITMNTVMSEANISKFPIPLEQVRAMMPVRRTGEPEDFANACAWLCHEDTGYVTGQTIGVNGGRVVS